MDTNQFIGLISEDAEILAKSKQLKFRVVSKDGIQSNSTFDFLLNRINVSIVNNKVIRAAIG